MFGKRFFLMAAILVSLLALASDAKCQTATNVKRFPPYVHMPIRVTEDTRIYGFIGLKSLVGTDCVFGGICHETSLIATPLGPFSVVSNAHLSLLGWSPAIDLDWYPTERGFVLLHLDLSRGWIALRWTRVIE
jgi:hypothetical protein